MVNVSYGIAAAYTIDIFGDILGIDPTTASFTGLSVLLLTRVLTWDDVKKEKDAWDTLIWFAALLMIANELKIMGFTTWFGNLIGDSLSHSMQDTNWVLFYYCLMLLIFIFTISLPAVMLK